MKDEKQCLWKGNMGREGEIILKYDNEAEKKIGIIMVKG